MPGKSTQTQSPQDLIRQAEQALDQAAASIASQQPRHQITAARLFVQAGDNLHALSALNNLDSSQLNDREFIDYSLFHSELALTEDNFFLARRLLSDSRLSALQATMKPDEQKQWLQLRGDLFALLGEDQKSIRAYITLSHLATGQPERLEIHNKLWQVLTNIPQQTLEALLTSEEDETLKGWYSLANISRETQSDVRLQLSYVEQWRQQWPTHPAAYALPSGLSAAKQVVSALPAKIALLLPMQGPLAQAGATIRDGFLAAWYDSQQHNQGSAPATVFYDTSNQHITDVYQQAVTQGAEIIIGPLQKEHVQALLLLGDLPVPTIALNYIDTADQALPQNLYQFGLSTTDEARQIAERAWIEGQRTALAIVPDTNWGLRALETFRAEWEARGGKVHVSEPYRDDIVDFAPLLKPSLHITHSEERAGRLERLLGKPLIHTPRRRQDLDMVFMAAYPDQARQIKPTLDFLFARDLQVYGTSQLFSGEDNPGRNRDLQGIRFSAMPWTLPGTTAERLQPPSTLHPLYRHMFALGIDAYHLHQWLEPLTNLPGTKLFGSTGSLQIGNNQKITRQQPWAEFRAGKVRSAQQLVASKQEPPE
jgi:outer membrane PBP1 activator LpoA protein